MIQQFLRMRNLFFDVRFVHYTWIGVAITLGNIVLLVVLIDVLGIPTAIAGSVGAVATWITRYLLFAKFKVVSISCAN